MDRSRVGYAVVVLSLGIFAAANTHALETVQPVALTTASVIVEPVAVTPTPVAEPVAVSPVPVAEPIAVATAPAVPGTQVLIPVTVPVDANRNQDIVAWKKLDGTVQSVDRANRLMTVQDAEGKNIRVAWNDRIRIYRSGRPVAYSDVSPNDHVVLRYNPDSKTN